MTRPLVPRLPGPWRPRPILPLLTLAVVVLGIATSAGVGMRTASGSGGSATGPVAPVAAITGAGHSVQIVGFAYAPQAITVTAGDSITWTNQDEAPHTVTTSSGPQAINSPNLSKGQSFTYTFTVPGTYSYYCAVHPDMRAQVVVKPAAAPSTSSPAVKPTTAAPPAGAHSSAGAGAHSAAPSTAHSGTSGTAPSSSSMAMPSSASMAMPSSAAPASSSSSSAAAPAPAASSSSAATDAAAPAAAAGSQSRLNPTLVLAGLTAAATVFCLLLLASRRPETASGEDGP
ncbi:MAG: cupredoxin family copper-binding protein [Catenulispora sp.]